ncbi:RYamide receptor-like [Glandiceps talaboti]
MADALQETKAPILNMAFNVSMLQDVSECFCFTCDKKSAFYDIIGSLPYIDAYVLLQNIIMEHNMTCPTAYTPPAILTESRKYALMILFFVTVSFSIIGNVVVICVLTCGTRRKREFNMFLLNLAIADWTLAIFSMPFAFMNALLNEWIFGDVMCPITSFIKKMSECVSIFTLTAIGIDRYYAVMYPLKNRMSTSRPKRVITGIWSISLCLSMVKPIVTYTKTYHLDSSNNSLTVCREWWPSSTIQVVYEITLFCTTYILPLIVLSFTYTRVAIKLWGRSLPGNADQGRDASHRKSKKRVSERGK